MKETNKFHVKLKNLKLQGFYEGNEKAVSIKIKWKGPQRPSLLSVPFYGKASLQRNRTAQKLVMKGELVDWEDEFESICEFPAVVGEASFGFWETKFYVLFGDSTKPKTKMAVMGKVSLNLAELLSKKEMQIDTNLPITLKDSPSPCQATLSVRVNFVEVRGYPDPNPMEHDKANGFFGVFKNLTSFKKTSREKGNSNDGARAVSSDEDGFPASVENTAAARPLPIPAGDQMEGVGKKRRLSFSFRHSKRKVEPLIEKTYSEVNDTGTVDQQLNDSLSFRFPVASVSAGSEPKAETVDFFPDIDGQYKEDSEGRWETREIVSRDGKVKLKTEVFFGSFDQRSEKAGGESACTAIVAVITHWLHSNQGSMPTRPELDSLIMEGSSEWQRLCSNESYSNSFPNKHFDLETVVEANVKPISLSLRESFVGFFSPEKFNCLTETMSFEQIWNEISSKTAASLEPRIYIVSWNDHFFVLKMDEDACYIVDSLGERLFEGCNQAYMLRFDTSSSIFENKENGEAGELVCRGKDDCCRQFFERFLAALTIEELEDEQKKLTSLNSTLHQRLQIDFHFSSLVSSSSTTSTCSLFSDEDCTSSSSPSV